MCMGIRVSKCNGVSGGWRTTFSRQFSLSTMWVLGVEVIASDLTETPSTKASHMSLIMPSVFYGPILLSSAEGTSFVNLVLTVAMNARLHIYTSTLVCTYVKVSCSFHFFFKAGNGGDHWRMSSFPGVIYLKKTCSPPARGPLNRPSYTTHMQRAQFAPTQAPQLLVWRP